MYSAVNRKGGYDLTCGDIYEWREALNMHTEQSCTEVTGNVWVVNDQISTYNRLELCHNDVCSNATSFTHRRYDNELIEETFSVSIIRQPKRGTECIINIAKPNNVNCSLTAKCMKQHAYSYVIEGSFENCYKGYQSQDCVPASNAKSLLTIPSYAGFTCSAEKQVVFNTSTVLNDINVLECQDTCIRDGQCSVIMYNIEDKQCTFGLPLRMEAGDHLSCSYDKQMADYRQLQPRNACPNTFTPHTNPAFDNFKTYVMGNIDFNTGAFDCEDCPAGQQSFSTTAYTCSPDLQLVHYCVVNNLVNSETCALKDASGTGERIVSLQDCKEFCDATKCTALNFKKQGNNDDEGKCYLMTSQLKAKEKSDTLYIACQKVFTSRICKPCPTGRYKADEGSCRACRVGQFQDEVGQANCKACPPNSYQNQLGQSECKDELSYFGELSNAKTIIPSNEIRYLPGTECSLLGLTGENSHLSKEQCQEYATNKLLLFTEQFHYKLPANCSLLNDGKVTFNTPMLHEPIFDQVNSIDDGIVRDENECLRAAILNNQFLKFGERTTGKVTDNNVEITSGPNTLTLNYAECKQYAESNNYDFLTDTSTTITGGCWNLNGQEVHYNYENDQNVDCSTTYRCIQRSIQGLSLSDCELYQKLHYPSTQYGSMFYTVSSGPNQDFAHKMSEFECQQFTSGNRYTWGGAVSGSYPHGCHIYGTTVYYQTVETSHPCGYNSNNCVHKYKRFQIQTNAGNPPGCFLYRPTLHVYYNFASASTASCSNDFKCVGASYESAPTDPVYKYAISGANDDSVGIDECRRFATMNSLSWGGDTYSASSGNPKGCFRYNTELYYNQGTTTIPCDSTFLCIQKQEHQTGEPYDSPTDVPGCGVQQEFVEVSDSSLNLESLTYRECEQYASVKSMRFVGDVGIHYYYTAKTSGTGAEFCSNKGYRLAKLTDADLNLFQRCSAGLWEHYGGYEWGGYKMNYRHSGGGCGSAGWNAFGSGYGLTSPYCAEVPNDYGPAGCFLYDHPTMVQHTISTQIFKTQKNAMQQTLHIVSNVNGGIPTIPMPKPLENVLMEG